MEPKRTLDEIAREVGGTLTGTGDLPVSRLCIDSRTALPSPSAMFIALTGERHDGHDFIGELYQKGIRAFLVSRLPEQGSFPGAGFCRVGDTLKALQQMAAAHRDRYTGTVVAITGSNGKTIVKEWIYQLMSGTVHVHRSPKSFNSQVGVPLSVWMMEDHHQLSVIEAGISRPGEMETLERIIRPGTGLLTHIGTAHQENFSSYEEKLQEKLKLFRRCNKVIYRSDLGSGRIAPGPILERNGIPGISWSLDETGDYRYTLHAAENDGTEIGVNYPSGAFRTWIPFRDEASVENALHALTFVLEEGLPPETAAGRVRFLEPVSMRLEILKGIQGTMLINDAYNSDPEGLSAALHMVSQHTRGGNRIMILSDLLQTGIDEEELYAGIARLAREHQVSRMIGIGPALMRQRDKFPEGSLFYPDTREFLKRADRSLFRDATVLIKGSRRFGFERITSELQLKTHQTQLEIDLNAMAGNLNYFRSLLHRNVKIMVMVKALAYGSGSTEIAQMLQFQKADYLAVAFIDEGVTLRKAGIHLPIMVLNPDPSGFPQMIEFGLEPEIYSQRGLRQLLDILKYREVSRYPVHIKLDTGMHRLGFQREDLDQAIPLLLSEELLIASVFSHLAASDEPENDPFTQKQIGRYEEMTAYLEERLGTTFDRHILNSAGIERFPGAQYQMVRLGIGLHGIGNGSPLEPASTYRTTVSQIRTVRKGEGVGYSLRGQISEERQIATLPVGYADGIDRRLGNGNAEFRIRGSRAATVGNICMDMTMIDVTGLGAEEGDPVELFGKQIPVSELSERAGTIPYEILTAIPERVKRIYLQE